MNSNEVLNFNFCFSHGLDEQNSQDYISICVLQTTNYSAVHNDWKWELGSCKMLPSSKLYQTLLFNIRTSNPGLGGL